MKKTKFSTCVATSMLALSLFLLPITTSTFAQTTAPTPQVRQMDTRDNDNTGLWGLLGLIGLIGLAGLRRPERARAYTDPHERSKI
jgi:MYXO-CTERM domain-containing protein